MALTRTSRNALRMMAVCGLGAWLAFWLSIPILGGSAANGYVSQGGYFLGEHGKYVQVSPETYRLSEVLLRVGLVGLPVAALGFFVLRRVGDPSFFFWGMAVAVTAAASAVAIWVGASVGAPQSALWVAGGLLWPTLLVLTAMGRRAQ
jgi:hypothetical protein